MSAFQFIVLVLLAADVTLAIVRYHLDRVNARTRIEVQLYKTSVEADIELARMEALTTELEAEIQLMKTYRWTVSQGWPEQPQPQPQEDDDELSTG